jgi:hypothetical protein
VAVLAVLEPVLLAQQTRVVVVVLVISEWSGGSGIVILRYLTAAGTITMVQVYRSTAQTVLHSCSITAGAAM